jgi:hypothetical protein
MEHVAKEKENMNMNKKKMQVHPPTAQLRTTHLHCDHFGGHTLGGENARRSGWLFVGLQEGEKTSCRCGDSESLRV